MKLQGKVCQCPACGKVFTATSVFDRHRVGEYDIRAPKYGRRCLTSAELEQAGYWLNSRGHWSRLRTAPLTHPRRPGIVDRPGEQKPHG